METDIDLRDRKEHARIGGQRGLRVAARAQPLGAGALEEASGSWRNRPRPRRRCPPSTRAPTTGMNSRRLTEQGQVGGGALGNLAAKVQPGTARGDAPARRARQEALLDQVGLDDILERAALLADRGREALDARPGRRRISP